MHESKRHLIVRSGGRRAESDKIMKLEAISTVLSGTVYKISQELYRILSILMVCIDSNDRTTRMHYTTTNAMLHRSSPWSLV